MKNSSEDQRITIVEGNLKRELWHLGMRIEWKDFGTAKSVYANIMNTQLPTSPEISRLQGEATEMMKKNGLIA